MGIIIVKASTLTKEELYELGKLLLKCGYEVQVSKGETRTGTKAMCIKYEAKEGESK